MIFSFTSGLTTRLFLVLSILLSFSGAVLCQSQLNTNTAIPIRITQLVSSETDTSALIVKEAFAVVDRNITSPDGRILVAANTPVAITATLQRSRGRGRAGSVLLTPISTTSTDNQTINLTGTYAENGRAFKGRTYLIAGATFVTSVVAGALLIASGTREDVLDPDDGKGARLAGGIILGLSPFSWLYLMRRGQIAEVPAGFVLEDVKPERSYEIK